MYPQAHLRVSAPSFPGLSPPLTTFALKGQRGDIVEEGSDHGPTAAGHSAGRT